MEILQYTFFQHALAGCLLASIVCGIIGTYIVTRRLVFISGGLTHASFGGIGLGLYAGISPILAAGVFAVLSAFGVEWLSKRKDMREDSAIAVFWTLGMALGIMFSFLSPGFAPDLSAYLFGNVLTITMGDIALLGGLAVLLALFFALYLHPIIYVAFDREFARSQGIPVQRFEYVLMMFIAAHHPPDDGQPFCTPFPPDHLVVHRHRLSQLPGRTVHILLPQCALRSRHHILFHHYLCDMQVRKEFLSIFTAENAEYIKNIGIV